MLILKLFQQLKWTMILSMTFSPCVAAIYEAPLPVPPPLPVPVAEVPHTVNCNTNTASEEPYGYYVCYRYMDVINNSYALLSKYSLFRYHGCAISYSPCNINDCHRQYFGWYRTTYQARNALYRCRENFPQFVA